ncbi:MAG: hypothetical protein FWG71_06925, partial [Synergistaceae bacterium]|nr:hypothetical protein [Synergistaceae bacterium]
MRKIVEKKVNPIFGDYEVNPEYIPIITEDIYKRRLRALLQRVGLKYSHIVIYADREHFSNVEYLTGFDPRFEEALLIITACGGMTLVVGLEGLAYCEKINFPVKTELCASFGLPGQPRDKGKKLGQILHDAGINMFSNVGIVGWKRFTEEDFPNYVNMYAVPHFITASIRELADSIQDVTDLFVSNDYGLRHSLCATEIALAETASVKASKGVYNVIKNLSEGMSEIEASRFLLLDGEPLGAHPNVNFGMPNVGYGIASPTHQKKLALGENISIGCAYRRALCHRSIMYAENEGQLPEEYSGCMEYLFKPYFMSIVKWYEAVGIGAVCKDVYDAAMEPLGSYEKYGVTLNPGHFIHTDEWSNSPFYK